MGVDVKVSALCHIGAYVIMMLVGIRRRGR
jgi:hypothetical protein